jgi:hypothetical protein
VRSNSSDEVDGALALLKLDTCMKQMNCSKLFCSSQCIFFFLVFLSP